MIAVIRNVFEVASCNDEVEGAISIFHQFVFCILLFFVFVASYNDEEGAFSIFHQLVWRGAIKHPVADLYPDVRLHGAARYPLFICLCPLYPSWYRTLFSILHCVLVVEATRWAVQRGVALKHKQLLNPHTTMELF